MTKIYLRDSSLLTSDCGESQQKTRLRCWQVGWLRLAFHEQERLRLIAETERTVDELDGTDHN
jgi:hypothetical protein